MFEYGYMILRKLISVKRIDEKISCFSNNQVTKAVTQKAKWQKQTKHHRNLGVCFVLDWRNFLFFHSFGVLAVGNIVERID